MSRTRFIMLPSQGEGRPCPPELTQQKACPVTPCYSWVLSNWSACKLEVGLLQRMLCSNLCAGGIHFPAAGARHNVFLCDGVREYVEKYNEGLNLQQSDTVRKMQSHSLGADDNGPGHRPVNLLGILKNSLLFSWLVGRIII